MTARTYLILTAILTLFSPLNALAQATASSEEQKNGAQVQVDAAKVGELIKTLESETARQDFIDNLKTLVEVNAEASEDDAVPERVTKTLGVDDAFKGFLGSYNEFLARNNLSSSTVGRSSLTLVLFVIILALYTIVHKGGTKLEDRLLKVKRRYQLTHNRYPFYAKLVRITGYILTSLLFIYSICAIWSITQFTFLKGDFVEDIFGIVFNVILITLLAAIIWEIINISVDYGISHSANISSTRLRTLLPIIHNVTFVIFIILFSLVLLSELGIDIIPLLAGAGILGIAVGFGAQTMVKDFLTGFIIILEDLIQVGDVARVGGKAGLIEKITIRKVQLRDLDGTVYTVPFSEIAIVENLTKHFSYYLMDIGIAYRENTDEVIGYLKEIDLEMRSEEHFRDLILEPLEVLGVDAFADSAVIIKARIKTKPIRQWDVGREFNRRMKLKFDEKGIEIPFPHQTLYFGEDKKGHAPSLPVRIE
ncbi:MAG: mechanosensitive ion channel family protein [Micavibrio sp.]|nr:mechanosensitive ion channel family protein [Micavibrio sp.]